MGNCAECVSSNDTLINIIAESKNFEFVVFSKPHCPECIKSRTLLFTLNKLPKIIELNRTHIKLREALIKATHKDRPPYIFRKGEYIGGLQDLELLAKKEKLSE